MKNIFPLAIILFIFSCKENNEKMVAVLNNHSIPNNFLNLNDTAISWMQDTLIYSKNAYSGKAFRMNENGDTISIESFWNGILDGPTKKWYSNKQIAESRSYVAGKKEGLQKSWWPNGQPKFEFFASDDAYEGVLKEWNEKGFLIKLFHYSKGQELGSQRLWWDDSTIRANYEIRNGKKYGLIGLKLCSNPYDSVNKK